MINIIIHYKEKDTPEERVKASYTKIRGNFFCIHYITPKDGPFRSKYIPADTISFIEQEDPDRKEVKGTDYRGAED